MAKEGRKKRRRRWRLRLFLVLLIVGIGGWYLPWLATREPLRPWLMSWALPELDGEVQVDDISASWFSPLKLHGVRLLDAQGAPLLASTNVVSEKTLMSLVSDSSQPGKIHVSSPVITITLREDGSNVEDLFLPLLASSPDDPPTTVPAFEVQLTGGRVMLQDLSGAAAEFHDLALTVTHDPAAVQPLAFDFSSKVPRAEPGGDPAVAQASGSLNPATFDSQLDLKLERLGAAAVAPLLQRLGGHAEARGELTADLKFQYEASRATPRFSILGTADARQFHLQSDHLLAGDAIDLRRLTLDVDCAIEDGELVVRRHSLKTDVGDLAAEGRFELGRLFAGDVRGLLNDEEYSASGRIDLARLANMLPALLQVREGTQFTAGELKLAVSSRKTQAGREWQGQIESTNLQGIAGGRVIAWREPVVSNWQATQGSDGELRGEATCTAGFLDLKARGTPVDVTLTGSSDLSRLREDLSQFFDLSGMKLAGSVAAEFRIRQGAPEPSLVPIHPVAAAGDAKAPAAPQFPSSAANETEIHAQGQLKFQNFVFQPAGEEAWSEPNMTVAVDATGQASLGGVRQIDRVLLQLTTPGDVLEGALLGPLVLGGPDPVILADVDIRGSLDSWYPRLRRLGLELPIDVRHVRGGIRGQARTRLTASEFALEKSKFEMTQVDFAADGLSIREPRIVFVGDARWDRAASRLSSRSSTWQSSAVSIRVDHLEVDGAAARQPSATGKVALAADLSRLQGWFRSPPAAHERQWAGVLTAEAELSHQAGVTTAEWEANMNDLVVTQPAASQLLPVRGGPPAGSSPRQTVWSEREVFLSGRGRHLARERRLELDRLEVSSDTLKLAETRGSIGLADGPLLVDLSGNVIYDLAKITALLQPYLGSEVQFAGTGTRPFAIRGPVTLASSLQQLTGNAGVGWSQASVYGLAVGQGDLTAELRDGVVHFAPFDLSLGQGRLKAKSRIELSAASSRGAGASPSAGASPLPYPQLVVDPGRAVENVRLSAELCHSWVKYVAPLLAEATRADGVFFVDLTRCRVPLTDRRRASVAGKLAIQSAQVRPGPVAEQLVLVAQQVEAIVKKRPLSALGGQQLALNIPPQEVPFELHEGRVYHRDLRVTVGDVTVKTSGSVGLDSSLQMVAEIPIQEAWVARDRHLKALAGQVVKVPLRGTLKNPRLDRRALDDLAKQMVGSAAGSLLDDAINRGLQDLFGN